MTHTDGNATSSCAHCGNVVTCEVLCDFMTKWQWYIIGSWWMIVEQLMQGKKKKDWHKKLSCDSWIDMAVIKYY